VFLPPPPEGAGDWGAKLVELGPPLCGKGGTPAQEGRCGEGEEMSFSYRAEPTGSFTKAEVASADAKVSTNKLLILLDGGVRDSLVKSAEGQASEMLYSKRLRALYDAIHGAPGRDGSPMGGLIDDGNKLETRLSTEASKGTKFSFFM